MVIPALPTLQRDLHTTTTWVTLVLTVFLLVASVATPIIGKLGDQYGKERLLTITLICSLAGCVGAALAWTSGRWSRSAPCKVPAARSSRSTSMPAEERSSSTQSQPQ